VDPLDGSRERYWDGWSWSRNTRQSGPQQPPSAPNAAPGPPPAGYGGYPQQPFVQPGPHPPVAEAPAGASTADGVPLAGWWWRFLAAIVDLIIVSIIGTICAIPVIMRIMPRIAALYQETLAAVEAGQAPPPINPTSIFSVGDTLLINSISMAVAAIYFVLFWRFRSASPGQLLCGLRVVAVDQGQNTEPLPWLQIVLRALVFAVPLMAGSVLFLIGVLNALFPLWNDKRQAIHDLVAKTQVVKIK
jgi:uncharacterized RDD family membrane protein YckC